MTALTNVHGLAVDSALKRFIDEQVLPTVGVDNAKFWQGFDAIVRDLSPKNAALRVSLTFATVTAVRTPASAFNDQCTQPDAASSA